MAKELAKYRDVFCRQAGYGDVGRYISGLLGSANQTWQGIYSQWVWPAGKGVSRRAIHESVFENGWSRIANKSLVIIKDKDEKWFALRLGE